MTDLRKAAEMALEALEDLKEQVTQQDATPEHWDAYYEKQYYALKALRQALAQQEQEPVAWLIQYKTRHDIVWGSAPGLRNNDQILGMEPLYTAPPKREWVGLEDEDVATVKNEFNRGALWAEKVLKEKNSYSTCPPCTHDCNEGRDCPARK